MNKKPCARQECRAAQQGTPRPPRRQSCDKVQDVRFRPRVRTYLANPKVPSVTPGSSVRACRCGRRLTAEEFQSTRELPPAAIKLQTGFLADQGNLRLGEERIRPRAVWPAVAVHSQNKKLANGPPRKRK
ncbi:hypothetical protein TQ29_02835 [Actibacterium sp. EMB200-NS6]|nr:hypothetical protein TQ29_02835 [Actibacterium sp. EMB200-NS6]